jgi:dolichol-phosphate mannosyltransferase
MDQNTKVVIIVPAYNAEGSINQVINALPLWVDCIIVVNDRSMDNTFQIVQGNTDTRLILLENQENLGVGGAMKRGYQEALAQGADIIVKMDSDGQMDPAYLPQLLAPIISGNANYTNGNRFLHTTELKQMPFIRRTGNLGLSFMTKAASGYWNIFDPTNGYTAIDSATLSKLNFNNLADRYFFESSMLIELYNHQAVVKDVPIPARYQGEKSSLSTSKSFFEFSSKLIPAFIQRISRQYFLSDFSAVSLLLFFGLLLFGFGLIWGIWHWIISIQMQVAATTGTVMLAVLPFIIGFQFLIQALVLDIGNVPKEIINRANASLK